MAALFGPLPAVNREAFKWVPDKETDKCMNCNAMFTVINRKHHCRRCGHIVCANCSPNIRRMSPQDPFPVRVCNPCYTALDEHLTSTQEWSGMSGTTTTEPERIPDPVANGRVRIGQLYVKVVEAIGLPSTDAIANSITSDPFVKLILTGRWSHGQEWGNDLQSIRLTKRKSRTLNPRWHETFVFNVCAPGAELVLEVFNSGQLSQPTKLGQARIPLSQLMDQRRHNKWLDLLLPPTLHREGLNNDARAGRIHVLLHFKFARLAEFMSHFAEEQPYKAPWPPFKAATIYNNFWILLDDLWPYLEIIWAISPTLNWEHPSRSFFWLVALLWMCLYIRWVPVVIHVFVIIITLKNYMDLSVKLATAETSVNVPPTTPSSSSWPPPSMEDAEPPRVYNLPQGFHHLTDKMTQVTTDADTKMTLQRVQNNMAWWSGIIKSIELMFSWEDFFYTLQILLGVIVSCILHIFLPNQYLLMALVIYLFLMWTVPFTLFTRAIYGLKQGILSLLHQHRLMQKVDARASAAASMSSSSTANAFMESSSSISSGGSRSRRGVSISRNEAVSQKESRFGAAATALSRRFAQELTESKEN
ncbi:unnamed protein product [Aphanomyces euteiches]|uniref:FYVE-type domain-containing protein n=1 Tax=Aphanomyces euteiches TaxID=100861 RepID=A0A6G0WE25_9STRA|nr:hypothetical protein Ae201684_015921 [Aphanomyces euteiches]KAH9088337.1 hypothetical protein Ae201684P_003031 [Aphanomyces euteiches]KAH9150864.1 hypothetical protein AeRB84_006389 [Aphanomyces euteiches]